MYPLWLVGTRIPARLRKGIQPERSKRMQKGRSCWSREGEVIRAFLDSDPWVLGGSAPWPLSSRNTSAWARGTGKLSCPSTDTIHQHNTMSFPVCKAPQDRDDELLSGNQTLKERGEVMESCRSCRAGAVNHSWVSGKGIFPLEQQREHPLAVLCQIIKLTSACFSA